MKKILVIHGPNLNLLGQREQEIYGSVTLKHINDGLNALARKLGVSLTINQFNHEGDMVEAIQNAKKQGMSAIVINPAAYTHTSVAIRDAILAVQIPAIEVHLSNIYAREDFRQKSMTAPVCHGQISGFGGQSYLLGLQAAVDLLK